MALALIACSTTSGETSGDAGAPATCGANVDAETKPRCQRGGPCFCDDTAIISPLCVEGAWKCPAGTTRWEDCFGVPPAGSYEQCVDAGKADAGNGS